MSVLSQNQPSVPIELILYVAVYLEPDDLVQLIHAVPGLDQLLTESHLGTKGKKGETILHVIARAGEDEWMRLFLAKLPIFRDSAGIVQIEQPPLYGHLPPADTNETITKINVNTFDRYRATPLHLAASLGHSQIVKMLLERDDILPDLEDNGYRTPLSYAAGNGHVFIVKLFLQQNSVKPDSKDYYERTPLSYAAENGHLVVVETLLQQDCVEADSCSWDTDASGRYRPDAGDRSPLSFAAENGHLAIVKLLAQREDVDINWDDDNNRSPISWAAKNGHREVVEYFLRLPTIVYDQEDLYGKTPLSYALACGHQEVAEMLREQTEIVEMTTSGNS